ncbi:MAG TPA: peptidylprolyl isomerase [Polyangiaceae bacterium]|nr:peptidylprolyl isomerase [Polyangiaceae bacterium]
MRTLSPLRGLAALGALSVGLALAPAARAVVVERVVAVVGEQAILLSDLRQRSRPILVQLHRQVPPGPRRAAEESKMYRQLLDRMVDDRLEQVAADRAKIAVTAEEIDRALGIIAAREKISVEKLLAEVGPGLGLTVQEYRDEVRRQILEEKLINLRVLPRIRITPEDVRVGYQQLQREERRQLGFRAQWVVLRVPPGSSPEAREERRRLAEQLSAEARAGADFGALARRYSDDAPTRPEGGDLKHAKPGELAAPVEEVAFALEVGEVSAPFVFGTDFIILRLAERDPSSLPPLAQAQDEVAARVFADRRDKAKRQWLDELKKSVHVDVRL